MPKSNPGNTTLPDRGSVQAGNHMTKMTSVPDPGIVPQPHIFKAVDWPLASAALLSGYRSVMQGKCSEV